MIETAQDGDADYWLSEDVFCTDVGDGVIFLDLLSNRYLGLPREVAALLSGIVRDFPVLMSAELVNASRDKRRTLAEQLLKRGLLSHSRRMQADKRAVPA